MGLLPTCVPVPCPCFRVVEDEIERRRLPGGAGSGVVLDALASSLFIFFGFNFRLPFLRYIAARHLESDILLVSERFQLSMCCCFGEAKIC